MAKNLVDSLKAEKPEASYTSIINKAILLLKIDDDIIQRLKVFYIDK